MRARTRGRAHARDGLDKKRGVPGGGPHPPTWSRTRGWDLAENRGGLRRPVAVWAALRRPVAVWGHLAPREPSGPLSGVLWPFGGIWPPESRLGRSPASCGRLGASGPQRAVWAALRRPVAVWGHLAPREPSGPLSGVLWPSGPLSGVLWPFGGIWPPESRLGRSPASCGRLGASGPQRAVWAALRRPVAVWGGLRSQGKGTEAENGLGAEIERRIFERSRHF